MNNIELKTTFSDKLKKRFKVHTRGMGVFVLLRIACLTTMMLVMAKIYHNDENAIYALSWSIVSGLYLIPDLFRFLSAAFEHVNILRACRDGFIKWWSDTI